MKVDLHDGDCTENFVPIQSLVQSSCKGVKCKSLNVQCENCDAKDLAAAFIFTANIPWDIACC